MLTNLRSARDLVSPTKAPQPCLKLLLALHDRLAVGSLRFHVSPTVQMRSVHQMDAHLDLSIVSISRIPSSNLQRGTIIVSQSLQPANSSASLQLSQRLAFRDTRRKNVPRMLKSILRLMPRKRAIIKGVGMAEEVIQGGCVTF